MAGVTLIVSCDSRRNRQRGAASQRRAVASGATILWPRGAGHVLRVIELHVETLFESIGKRFTWRIVPIHVCVADRAHRNVWRRELRQVTSCAVFVTGKAGPRGIIVSMVTRRAGN